MDLVSAELPAKTLVVAIDPGKVNHRVLLADGERGLIGEPVSLPTLREGIERLCELIESQAAPETVIAIEATGSLHLPWVAELERRLPRLDSPLRPVRDPGRAYRPGLTPLQGRRPRLRRPGLPRPPGARPSRPEWDSRCAPRCRPPPSSPDRPTQGRPPAPAPPAERALPGTLRTGRPRAGPWPWDSDGPGRAGLRGRLRWQGAWRPIADRQGPGSALARRRHLLV